MKYFPDCYRYDEDELNRILLDTLQTNLEREIQNESRQHNRQQDKTKRREGQI